MREGRFQDSPLRAWSAQQPEGECARWSTAIDGHVRIVRRKTGSGRANLECAADAEDAVVGLLGGQALDGFLDSLALLGNQVIIPRND